VTASREKDSWAVPGSDAYMVRWENHHPSEVNVTYAFQLIPPPPDLWPLALLGVVAAGSISAWFLGRRSANRSK